MNITFNYMRSLSLKNKKLLITGGTSSFGNALLDKFLNTEISEIRILSRDEKSSMTCVSLTKQSKNQII